MNIRVVIVASRWIGEAGCGVGSRRRKALEVKQRALARYHLIQKDSLMIRCLSTTCSLYSFDLKLGYIALLTHYQICQMLINC